MGHIVLAAPGVDRYHLIERLVRELVARGHRATLLCLDAAEASFWRAQSLPVVHCQPGRAADCRAPLEDLADVDCRRRAQSSRRHRKRVVRRLAQVLPGVLRWFELAVPDLLLLHQRRTSSHALLQFVARECGMRTLWTGEGLLPHTLQIDDEGLDGDARVARRSSWDFRALPSHAEFLESALAAVAGKTVPTALSRRALTVPSLRERLVAALQSFGDGTGDGLWTAFAQWRTALPQPPLPPVDFELPARPFVAVLLQREDDDRLRLDTAHVPNPRQLVTAARTAARALERDMPVVAVLPRTGLLARELAPLRTMHGVRLETPAAAAAACLAAAAVITVNDGTASTALLADTPVVHLGRALWGVPGVAVRGTLDTLTDNVRSGLDNAQPELRRRFLGWLLAHGHVWCSVQQPDYNGLSGLVLQIERRLRGDTAQRDLPYRAGPAWPLAAEGR